MAITVDDSKTGVVGYVVIHNFGEQGGCGGVRALPDVSLQEVKELARAMAYKYAFFRLPQGGAKGGIRMDYQTPPQERQRLVQSFGKHIALLLSTYAYQPWTDMNFNGDDLTWLYAAASLSTERVRTESSERTALSTFAGIIATAEHLRIPPHQCRVAIEGFGNVGGVLAQLIADWGGKVVGVSNTLGAVVNERGLDVCQLLKLRSRSGQECLTYEGDWLNVDRSELFRVQADILVPGARVHVIDETQSRRLDVRAVVPAANVPCTASAERILIDRDILLLPDFVVNGGGVLGIVAGKGTEEHFFRTEFKDLVSRLLDTAECNNQSPIEAARSVANFNSRNSKVTFLQRPSRVARIAGLLKHVPLVSGGQKQQREQQKAKLCKILTHYFTASHVYE